MLDTLEALWRNFGFTVAIGRSSPKRFDRKCVTAKIMQYQQLVWRLPASTIPIDAERFEVCLSPPFSLTRNHRIRVKVTTDEETPVPTVTHIWPKSPAGSSARFSIFTACCSRAIPIFAASSPTTAFAGPPVPQGLPAHRICRDALFGRSTSASSTSPSKLAQDFRTFDFMSALGRRRLYPPRR